MAPRERRMDLVARAVVEELRRQGAPEPEVAARRSTVAITFPPEERFGLSVDRGGVVRAWAHVESVTFYEDDATWREQGRDVAAVVRELRLRAGFGGG